MKLLQKHFSTFALILLLVLLPLYTDDSYFNIIEAKTGLFYLCFFIILPLSALQLIYSLKKKENLYTRSFDITDIGVTAFMAVSLISCLSSGRAYDSFTGSDGWYVGAALFMALTYLYFYFSRCHRYDQNVWLPVYGVYIIVISIALFQFAGQDFFGFNDRLIIPQHFQYISTYGNTNWFAGCLCLIIPIALIFFMSSKTRTSLYVNLIFLSFALAGVLICISDGIYLGLGFAAFFVLPYIFSSMKCLRRVLLIGIIFSAEAAAISRMTIFNTMKNRAMGFSRAVLDHRLNLVMLVFFIAAFTMCSVLKHKENKKVFRALCIISELSLAVGVIFIIRDAVIGFTDTWGSSRGFIWRVSLEHYAELDLPQKLFGIGPDLLRAVYSEVEFKFQGLAVLSSHSEPIQILLTTGIAGLLSWFCIIAGVIIGFVRHRHRILKDKIRQYAFFLALAAYFGQSLVNSATTVNLCLLYIILSLYRNVSDRKVETQTEGVL